jgi:hypothetical protein
MTDTSVDDELLFTYVDRVFADPCQPQRGLSPTIGRDAASLVAALTTRLGLDISLPAATEIDGRPATTLVVTAPPDLAACTDARLALWGLPEEHALAVRQVDRLWIVDAPNGRLVISALSSPATAERSVAAMEGMVTSLRFGVEPELPPPPYSPPPEGAEEPLGFLPPEGPIPKGGYVLRKTLYGYDARGVAAPLPGTYDAVMYVPAGWFPTGNGIADRPTDPTARVGVWTLRSINLDPCHWQTSDTADPPMVRSQASLAEALHAWWTDPSAADGNDDLPFPFAPVTSAPVERPWMSRATPYVDIQIPADLDLATCDGGEYRLWDDHDGRARTAQPGESIRVAVVDMEPGLAVLEYGWTPAASASTRAGLEQSGPDVSLLPTNWRIEHEGTVPQP